MKLDTSKELLSLGESVINTIKINTIKITAKKSEHGKVPLGCVGSA